MLKRAIVIALFPVLMVLSGELISSANQDDLVFKMPVNPEGLKKYLQYGKPAWDKIHAGIDLQTPDRFVIATAPGKVILVQGLEPKKDGVFPDHGFGNTVIIEHELEEGGKIYSLYAHLKEIDPRIRKESKVSANQVIGIMGASGYGEIDYWLKKKGQPIHLHFEIKDEAVLADPKTRNCYGYVPEGENPDNYGYHNPYDFFGKKRVKLELDWKEYILYSLIQKLKDQDPNIRKKAAKTLGEIKDPRAVEPLIDAMKDLIKHVREEAARALGKIKDPRAVEPLIFAVKNDKYNSVRRVAIWALGEIGDPHAVDLLISVLKDEIQAPFTLGDYTSPTELGEYAAIALRKIGGPAVKPLIGALKSAFEKDDASVQVLAEKAFKGIKDQRAVEPLIAALEDEYWKVREIAADILGELNDHRAIEPLIVALGDKHPLVQSSAKEALMRITGKDFGKDQRKWKEWWERNLKPEAKADEVPMWVFEPLTHTSTYYSPRYPRRLMYPVSEISGASEELVYFIESKKRSEIKEKINQLVFLRNLIIKEMETGLKRELETLRPDVAEDLKNNLLKILKESKEIISLAEAPAFQNNLEKIKSIQNQINQTAEKIIHILE